MEGFEGLKPSKPIAYPYPSRWEPLPLSMDKGLDRYG